MAAEIIAQARAHRTSGRGELADHLARVERACNRWSTSGGGRARATNGRGDAAKLHAREHELRHREETFRKRLDQKIEERLREARREIDRVVDALKTRPAAISERRARLVSTGEIGGRVRRRGAMENVEAGFAKAVGPPSLPRGASAGPATRSSWGSSRGRAAGPRRIVQAIHDGTAEVDVRGKRMRARLDDVRVDHAGRTGGAAPSRYT